MHVRILRGTLKNHLVSGFVYLWLTAGFQNGETQKVKRNIWALDFPFGFIGV